MNCKFLPITLIAAVTLGFCVPVAKAQESKTKTVDPSGTWRWTFEGNDSSIESALALEMQKGGKVTGVLSANDRKIEINGGKIDSDQLSLAIQFEMQSRQITGLLEGKIKGDELEGSIEFKTDEGRQQFPWKAERTVEPEDLVGDWDIAIDSPDGAMHSKAAITLVEGKPKVVVTSQDGSKSTATNVKIADKNLTYDLKLDFQGSDLLIKVKGRPYGSKISGTIEYPVNGEEGELSFEGKRKPSKKKE